MSTWNLVSDYNAMTLISLLVFAFLAGFIDAVVGGGGLIQLPALLINLPNVAIPTLFGTNKIAALSGTSVAAYRYSKRIKFDFGLLLTVALFAFLFSFLGAKAVSQIDVNKLKPIILVILVVIAVYTFIKKELGAVPSKALSRKRQMIYGTAIGTIIGFYDGFFGPGTGSFLVLGFVVVLGFEFIAASAYSKVINCITNISALIVFIHQGSFILGIGLLMAVGNISGSIIGSRLAIKKGNGFIRLIFLFIVVMMIIKYAFDIYSSM
ncbi:MAG: sulfite exporter TauE/SafE family protein [Prolixibacteraceae bacterium]